MQRNPFVFKVTLFLVSCFIFIGCTADAPSESQIFIQDEPHRPMLVMTIMHQNTVSKMSFRLFPEEVRSTMKRFLDLVEQGAYNNIIFDRYDADFIGAGKQNNTIQSVIPLEVSTTQKHAPSGTLAFSHGQDIHSGTTEWYITRGISPKSQLDNSFAILGQIAQDPDNILSKIDETSRIQFIEVIRN